MVENSYIRVKQNTNIEYSISDLDGINIGKVSIIRSDNKNILCTLKMYKSLNNEAYLGEILDNLLDIFIYKQDFKKISFIVVEDTPSTCFVDRGFELEGILWNSIFVKSNIFKSEFIFGISEDIYKRGTIKSRIEIAGERIHLSILTPMDGKDVFDYCMRNKEHLQDFEPNREEEYYTIDLQKKYLTSSYREYLNGKEVNFGIYLKDKLIGRIRIVNIFLGVIRNCTIGYSIDFNEQGKGYMKEALNLASDYAKNILDLHRIEASTLIGNVASQAVLKSCGFEELGINKKYIYINGEWKDHIMFYKILS